MTKRAGLLSSAVHAEVVNMWWMSFRARLVVALWLLAALPCAPAVAQQAQTATVRGTILDQTGAVVPGVRVTIVDVAGAVRGEATTDAAGPFVFQGLVAGAYEVRTR